MTATVEAPAPARRVLATGAAIFLAIYAVTAAWIVLAATADPPALEIEYTRDGSGLIVRGTIDTDANRTELLDTLGEITQAAVILSDVEVDADAAPPDSIEQAAWHLVRSLPGTG